MNYLRGAFWGIVTGMDLFAILVIVTMNFGYHSVFYWLWDTTYGVWYLAGASAILGVSFAYSTRNTKSKRFVIKTNPQGVSWGRVLTNKSSKPLTTCQGVQIREGKKWKII